jgi:hypothetical protein
MAMERNKEYFREASRRSRERKKKARTDLPRLRNAIAICVLVEKGWTMEEAVARILTPKQCDSPTSGA